VRPLPSVDPPAFSAELSDVDIAAQPASIGAAVKSETRAIVEK
jgi:hypothetical protein